MPVSAVVLIHSPFVGPLTWRGVASELAAAGFTPVVPDIRDAHDAVAIAEAVASQLPPGVAETVLIGHSGVGPLLPAIADRLGNTAAVVYVDAGLPRPGVAWVDEAPAELVDQLRATVDSEGWLPPWPDWFPAEALAEILPDAEQRADFRADVPRQPWSLLTEPGPTAQWSGMQSYVLLSEAYRDEAERLRAAGHPVVEQLSDHLAPLTQPVAVAAALGQVVDRSLTGLLFGPEAITYDEVRPTYPVELVEATLVYAGHPTAAVESGAGTGKATESFAAAGLRLTCVEPDPGMAAVLRRRFADRPQVTVVERRFEDWSPPDGGCDLLYFALSWHWADPDQRVELAHRALRPGGTLALLSHQHGFADEALETKVHEVYERHAPHLRTRPFRAGPEVIEPLTDELTRTGRFGEVRSVTVTYDHPYPTARYLGLLRTFSPHLALAPARRRLLHDGIGAVIDANGGVLMLRLLTSVVLARSVAAQNPP